MKRIVYKSYDELPLMLSVPEVRRCWVSAERERMSW